MLSNNWKLGDRPELGAMNVANSLIRTLDFSDPDAIPNLRNASTILVGSDYSGQHATSQFEALCFLFVDADRSRSWLRAQKSLRKQFLPDGRRLSYKALNDRQRNAALPRFLEATNLLSGLLVVILVDKSIESLFKSSGRIESSDPEIQSIAHWAPHVVEKLLRVCHFASFFLSGLSREYQDVLWITDQDDIAANVERHGELVSTFGRISSHYLPHTLGHLRIATTASDTGKRDVEDFVAIADLAAGAICETLNTYHRLGIPPAPGVTLPIPNGIDAKVLRLMNWFSDSRSSLKRLVLAFEPLAGSTRLRVRHYSFN
ncbi:hypothetical protein [Methylococcus mesophilus]|uniref:hypothetical protein n=1 Tax=Methylococcus mesophilus TaxID=2993564 RepID=UPI00224AD6FC|nr:hypothetical protein [Methylococcus mesophilus]UZR28054.1 hypothetical protein OOT43_15240 [Methylococcus mesophilus]